MASGGARVAALLAILVGAAAPAAGGGEPWRAGDWSMRLPLGLPADALYVPADNPMSAAKVALGRALFFDPRLSKDGRVACATCHQPAHGFADPRPISPGVGHRQGARHTPTILNRLFSVEQFWDGRAADLEAQVEGPLLNPLEMGMTSPAEVVANVRAVPGYAPLFARAFGDPAVDMPRIARAIAAYERTLLSGDSPYDRHRAGDAAALRPEQVRGLAVFEGRGRCVTCHVGFNFTDEGYRNVGVGMDRPDPDLGRYLVTGRDEDRGAFKTPTLRNVALTAPYMHDGSEPTLEAVIDLYDRGGVRNPWLSKDMQPLGLSPGEKRDLLAFLHALTGPVTDAAPPPVLP